MYIKQTWKNKNNDLTSIEIRRADAREGVTDAPVLQTLPGDQEYFVDETVVRDNTYYYQIRFIRGEDHINSPTYELVATTSTGPGTQVLVAGDLDMGYFGKQNAVDLNLAGWTSAMKGAMDRYISAFSNLRINTVYKYVNKGRVCFLLELDNVLNNFNVLPEQIVKAGCAGSIGETINGVAQNTMISVDGFNYDLRMVDFDPAIVSYDSSSTDTIYSSKRYYKDLLLECSNHDDEFTRVIYRCLRGGRGNGWGPALAKDLDIPTIVGFRKRKEGIPKFQVSYTQVTPQWKTPQPTLLPFYTIAPIHDSHGTPKYSFVLELID